MAVLFGKSVGGGSSLFTTPDQVTGLQAVSSEEGILLSVDQPTEESYEYLKDYWVTFKLASEGEIQHPYDGEHIIFAKPPFIPGTPLEQIAVGSIIKIQENQVFSDFYVACHDYESTLNGTGRTLVVRKDCFSMQVWDNALVNAYASSDIDSLLNTTYKNILDSALLEIIGTTKFVYTPGNGNTVLSTLERTIFALSATELGKSNTYANVEGTALPIAATLQLAYFNGSPAVQWTRSPNTGLTNSAFCSYADGNFGSANCNNNYGARPCFTVPIDKVYVNDANELVVL